MFMSAKYLSLYRVPLFFLFFAGLILGISGCGGEDSSSKTLADDTMQSSKGQQQYQYTGKLLSETARKQQSDIPLLKDYKKRILASLKKKPPVLTLEKDELGSDAAVLAQSLALSNPAFIQYTVHPKTREPLRNEIMNVRPLLASDRTAANSKALAACKQDNCYRVEMYNHFFSLSTIAFVDVNAKKVLMVSRYSDAQPDINKKLVALAIAIAKNADLVKKELKEADGAGTSPTMSQIKTSLKNSRCERSHHLCVAPTFVVGDKALWAIVDLTDGDLVGTRWTELGKSGPPIEITERQLENEYVFSQFCQKSQHYQKGNWQFDYQITSSDGLQLSDVKYQNKTVMKSVKLLDWHVSYSSRENFGYSDAIGCPLFSSAVVIAYDGPKTKLLKDSEKGKQNGFAFIQDFRQPPWPTPCNYRYEQRFEFYDDGRFRVAAADYGRGCGTDGTYRPVLRIDIEASENGVENFSQWTGKEWQTWEKEQWHLQSKDTAYTGDGYLFKITDPKGAGYYLEPNRGQFGDGSKGDFAYTYVTVNHPDLDEGKTDMVTIGSCCNTNYKQGPEQFMQPPEPLKQKNLVLWYVPQIKNNGTPGEEYCWADTQVENGIPKVKVWPCYAGPMFVPIK